MKNNAPTQVRIPEFPSSPSRRLRTEIYPRNDYTQLNISGTIQKEQDETESQRQNRLEKKRESNRLRRMNETDDQHQQRLENQRLRNQMNRATETEKQRQNRLTNARERTRSIRRNETEKQHQNRLANDRERTRSTRRSETEEQRLIRLEKQKKRSQANRNREKLEKRAFCSTDVQCQNIGMQLNEKEVQAPPDGHIMSDFTQLQNSKKKNKSSNYSPWPEPLSRDLKEACLKKFLRQMSMSVLAEATCAVCNVRTPMQKSKKIAVSRIPNIDILIVPEDLKALIENLQSTAQKHSDTSIDISVNGNNIRMPGNLHDDA